MPPDCRLLLDPPADGAWNMAVDEALLDSAAAGGPATLRLYQWRPTLSLGYFQAYADRHSHAASAALPCVRRSSGGGALVHDRELTYSLTLPPAALAGRPTRALYCQAHKAILAAIADLGGDASRLVLCDPDKAPVPVEPFLCFQRRADGDLLVEGPQPGAEGLGPHPRAMATAPPGGRYKVCGSAQRKRHGALLQHGGVLLARSDTAPELPGLAELGVADLNPTELATSLADRLAEALGLRLTPAELSEAEVAAGRRLLAQKHASPDWVQRR